MGRTARLCYSNISGYLQSPLQFYVTAKFEIRGNIWPFVLTIIAYDSYYRIICIREGNAV